MSRHPLWQIKHKTNLKECVYLKFTRQITPALLKVLLKCYLMYEPIRVD